MGLFDAYLVCSVLVFISFPYRFSLGKLCVHVWMFLQHSMMASQGRTGFRERLSGHSFVAGFKEFLQEDPT